MPIHELTAPNGDVYDLTVPDDATPEQIVAAGRMAMQSLTQLAEPGGYVGVDPSGQTAPVAAPASGPTIDPTTSTTTVRPSTDFAPGERLRASGGNLRGAGQMVGGTLGSLLPPPMNVVAAPALSDLLGRGGEGAQALYERATGQPPSVAGTPDQRVQAAGMGGPAAALEMALQFLPMLGSALGAGGRAIRAGTPAGADAAREALLNRAEVIGPGIKSIAARTGGLADEGFSFFNPQTGRALPAGEVGPTVAPLARSAPIATVLKTVANPDAARTLMAVAETDAERALVSEAVSIGKSLGKSSERTIDTGSILGRLARPLVAAGIGHASGIPFGGVVAGAAEAVAERMLRGLVNRAAASPAVGALAGGTVDALGATPAAAQWMLPTVGSTRRQPATAPLPSRATRR